MSHNINIFVILNQFVCVICILEVWQHPNWYEISQQRVPYLRIVYIQELAFTSSQFGNFIQTSLNCTFGYVKHMHLQLCIFEFLTLLLEIRRFFEFGGCPILFSKFLPVNGDMFIQIWSRISNDNALSDDLLQVLPISMLEPDFYSFIICSTFICSESLGELFNCGGVGWPGRSL